MYTQYEPIYFYKIRSKKLIIEKSQNEITQYGLVEQGHQFLR